ncbi:MAG: zinc-ribbon domain-containing protein [Candidatus Aenigmatarchaeota archaeon]
MADEEDINSIKRDMEDLDARIDQLEDLQLTNKLNIIELRKEFDRFEGQIEKSDEQDVSEDVESVLERLEKEKKELKDWKEKFGNIDDKVSGFDKRLNKIKNEMSSNSGNKDDNETDSEGNICESCGMNNDPDAKFCIVCGNEL